MAVGRLRARVFALLLERVPQLDPDRHQAGGKLKRAAIVLRRQCPITGADCPVAGPDRGAEPLVAPQRPPYQASHAAVFERRPKLRRKTLLFLPFSLFVLDRLAQT